MDVLSEFCPKEDTQPAGEKKKSESLEDGFGFAIDIGTTTLAIQLIDLETGECRKTYTGLNPQRSCGADVISVCGRKRAAFEGTDPGGASYRDGAAVPGLCRAVGSGEKSCDRRQHDYDPPADGVPVRRSGKCAVYAV